MDGRPGIRAERATAAFQFIQKRRHIVHRSFEIKAATGCKPDRSTPRVHCPRHLMRSILALILRAATPLSSASAMASEPRCAHDG